jgi:hypothetical protein
VSIDGEWSDLKTASIALNELFNSLCDAGFTEPQALRLLGFVLHDITFGEE